MKNKMTHPLDVGYLVMGLIFLGIAGTWALRQADVIDLSEMDWLLPAGLIAAGAIGLLASAAKSVSRRRASRRAAAQEPYDAADPAADWAPDWAPDWTGYGYGYDPMTYAPHDDTTHVETQEETQDETRDETDDTTGRKES